VGKLEYCLDLIHYFIERGNKVVFVTVDAHPDAIREGARRFDLELSKLEGESFVFVDCFSATIGQDSTTGNGERMFSVSSLSNLEQIGMNIMKGIEKLGKPIKVFFYTVSPLFLHNSPQAISKFFQIVSSQIKTKYGFVLFVLHDGVHDSMIVNTLEMFSDGVIEMKFDEKLKRMMRIHHMRGIPTNPTWLPFDLRNGKFHLNADGEVIARLFVEHARKLRTVVSEESGR